MSHQPLLSRILFLCCLLALSPMRPRAQTDNATISGRVTFSGAPARGVRVTLAPGPYGDSKTSGRQNMRTDEEGRFEFTGLKPGRYGLLAASYVYVSEDLFSQPMRPFKLCTVSAGEKLTGQDLRMVRGGVITGRVTHADGRPAINERLHLSFVDAGGKRTAFPWEMNYEMRATDDRGVYRIFGLPPGRYLVGAGQEPGGSGEGSARGYVRRIYYPGVADAERAELIEIRDGREVAGIDLRLGPVEKTYAIRGRVIDAATGKPSPGGATDFYLHDNRTGKLRPNTFGDSANDRGEFNYAGLPPGRYGVAGTHDVRRNVLGELHPIEIRDEDVEGLEIKLERGASIRGTVSFEGGFDGTDLLQRQRLFLRPFQLDWDDPESIRLNPTIVQPDGSFWLNALPAGRFRLQAGTNEPGLALQRVERNGAPMPGAFELKAGEEVAGVRVVMTKATGALRGRLVTAGPLPADAAFDLTLRATTGNEMFTRPLALEGGSGFFVSALAVGEYEIVVARKRRDGEETLPEPLRRRVTIRADETTDVVIEAPQ